MTTTTQTHGGGAQPASIDTSGKATGGAALRVYGFDSEADAIAAGYVCEGGPAMSVALITDAQIASGAWRLEGDPSGTAVYTAPSNMPVEGGFAVPVYPVNGWGSTPAPAGPQFSAAEIGTVNASTVAVTFDSDVSASDYGAGVTIKVNGTDTSITSATRQTNHAIVYYVIPVLWHGSGDVVTWEYASGSGNIVSEADSTPLGNVTAQSVTNNCGYETVSDLQADTLALNDGDPISTWSDVLGRHNFTQTGNARPSKVTVGGYPAYYSLGVTDDTFAAQHLIGPTNLADNLPLFAVMYIGKFDTDRNWSADTVSKEFGGAVNVGWRTQINAQATVDIVVENGNNLEIIQNFLTVSNSGFIVFTSEKIAPDVTHVYVNGSNTGESSVGSIANGTYGNTHAVIIGASELDLPSTAWSGWIRAVLIIELTDLANWAANRAALEARLAARYGITL